MSVPAVVDDKEPHLFNLLYTEYVINTFLVEPTLNGTKIYLVVVVIGPCIEIPKQKSVPFSHIYEKILIVNIVDHGSVVQVDPGGVQFFALLGILVHLYRY